MATPGGSREDHLTHFERLCQTPETYHIFMALRVIEARFGDAPRLGTARRPREDAVRLGQEPDLAFPPSTIRKFTPPQGNKPAVLSNRFFGLFGPHGPLPLHLTEFARERLRSFRDPTFVAFADMLTHRLMSLLYRAWATGQAAPSFDRGEGSAIERKVAALAGFDGAKLRDRDAMPDLAKRYYTGHLASGSKNAEGLVSVLSSFFGSPVEVQQFVGCWLDLMPDDQWQLGAKAGLGQATSIGTRVWSRASKFRIKVGPLSFEEYRRILPGDPSMERLTAIVRTYAGDALDWDINLVLKSGEVPAAVLGQDTRLGQTSWIGSRSTDTDAEDLFLAPQFFTEKAA